MANGRHGIFIGLLFAVFLCGCSTAPVAVAEPVPAEAAVFELMTSPAVHHITLAAPTVSPTPPASPTPSPVPTEVPTPVPTPTLVPTATPKSTDTPQPKATPKPTKKPTATTAPTEKPTPKPTAAPTPTAKPTVKPTEPPVIAPAAGQAGGEGTAQATPKPTDNASSDDEYSSEDVYLAAQVAYLEAKGKGADAYRAVLSVILNRVNYKKSDIPTEVYRANQFSVVDDDDFSSTVPPDEVVRIADDVFNHNGANLPSKVRYFRAASKGTSWYDSFHHYDTIGGNAFFYEE